MDVQSLRGRGKEGRCGLSQPIGIGFCKKSIYSSLHDLLSPSSSLFRSLQLRRKRKRPREKKDHTIMIIIIKKKRHSLVSKKTEIKRCAGEELIRHGHGGGGASLNPATGYSLVSALSSVQQVTYAQGWPPKHPNRLSPLDSYPTSNDDKQGSTLVSAGRDSNKLLCCVQNMPKKEPEITAS